jgi:glycosyltransferase involved in cell wall biosynthesis
VSDPRVLYWVFNYMPEWEAVSKEVASLLHGLEGTVEGTLVSLNTKHRHLRLAGREKRIPLPHGLPFYPLLKRYASRFDVNHLFASGGERLLTPVISRYRGVLTLAKDTTSLGSFDQNKESLARLKAIVVQARRDWEILRQIGVREAALRVIRPGIPIAPYSAAQGQFTILFASSPLSADDFLSRGIYLIAQASALLSDVRFLLVWRQRHLAKLERVLADVGSKNIEIVNGLIEDMSVVYDRVHATILPGLEHRSFIPCPRSGLESLAHGKPLLLSTFVSLAESVVAARAGIAFEPTIQDMVAAVRELQRDYLSYQVNTHSYIAERFSPATHLELYRQLYRSL